MGLRLVNCFPANAADYIKPGHPLQFGVRSEFESVDLGTVDVSFGLTSLHNQGILPEEDVLLPRRGLTVTPEAPERIRPVVDDYSRQMISGSLVITKASSQHERSVYELKTNINKSDSVLAYIKFKKRSWATGTRFWCDLDQMAPPFFALENGVHNNALYVFLRGAGTGTIVIGGPTQTDTTRPMQREFAVPWKNLADGDPIELWIAYKEIGYTTYDPIGVPVVELWVRTDPLATPTLLTKGIPGYMLTAGSLLQFPTPDDKEFTSRLPTDTATLYIGNGGQLGDVVEVTDWALFPDFRDAVQAGSVHGPNRVVFSPNSLVEYNAANGSMLRKSPGPWRPALVGAPAEESIIKMGRPVTASQHILTKGLDGGLALSRVEPRLEGRLQGFMLEGFLSGEQTTRIGDVFGAGFSASDKVNVLQLGFLETEVRKTVGLLHAPSLPSEIASYFTPAVDVDWSSLHMYRILVDREVSPARVVLEVDDEAVIEKTISDFTDSATALGEFRVGFLVPNQARGSLNVNQLRYQPGVQGWNVGQGWLPQELDNPFTLELNGTGTIGMSDGELVIEKSSYNNPGTGVFFERDETDLDSYKGAVIDFKVRVLGYGDLNGEVFARNCWVGSGVELRLQNKKVHLGFFDCGTNGRRIGIIPGSGTADDIINLTELGAKFSTQVDWSQNHTYRLVYRPFDSIQVFIGSVVNEPSLVIPWEGGFDLPDISSDHSVAFGHFDWRSGSSTSWTYFRYGISDGYDVAVTPLFPDGIPSYAFAGRALVRTEFDE